VGLKGNSASPQKLMQFKIGETHWQVRVALVACLVAGTFAAGQGSNAPSSTKSKKPSAEAVAVRLSEMQKAIEAQQQQIQQLVEQVQAATIRSTNCSNK
jgi:hypothetical protein